MLDAESRDLVQETRGSDMVAAKVFLAKASHYYRFTFPHNLRMDLQRDAHPLGDGVSITMSGKFLPYKTY